MKDVRLLLEMRRARVPNAECAKRLGRATGDCSRYWKKYGEAKTRKQRPEGWEEKAVELHHAGHAGEAIGRALAVPRHAVLKLLHARGLKPNRNAGEPGRKRLARAIEESRIESGWSRGDYTSARSRQRAEAMGWPEAPSHPHARLLALLLDRGPTTERQLAEALEYTIHPKSGQCHGVRYLLKWLLGQGHIVKQRGEGGKTRPPLTYDLSEWMRARKEHP